MGRASPQCHVLGVFESYDDTNAVGIYELGPNAFIFTSLAITAASFIGPHIWKKGTLFVSKHGQAVFNFIGGHSWQMTAETIINGVIVPGSRKTMILYLPNVPLPF